MGQDIQYNNVNINITGRATASAMCFGAARSDYRGCDSVRVARLGSHAARGGRGGRSSANTMRVVVIAHDARAAVQLALRNNYYISAAPKILFIYMDVAPCTACGLIIKVSRRRGR